MLTNISVWFQDTSKNGSNIFPMVMVERDGEKRFHYRVTQNSLNRLTDKANELRNTTRDRVCVSRSGWAIFYYPDSIK